MSRIYRSAEGQAAVQGLYRTVLDRWPVPHEERRIATREGEAFVVVCGPAGAAPLVLLHGSSANAAMWMAEARAWSEHFRLHVVDLVGEPGFSAPSRPSLKSGGFSLWLDEAMSGLGLERAALVGASLGGWLAVDYAIRRPQRVAGLVLICPGGVGRQKPFLLKALPLLLLGPWGRRRMRDKALGGTAPKTIPPALQPFVDLMAAIFDQFRPRMERLPVFDDTALQGLTVPVLAIVGAKDALLDSADTRRRLQGLVAGAEVVMLPEAGHLIRGQAGPILHFLRRTQG